jgi:hypothetical protein
MERLLETRVVRCERTAAAATIDSRRRLTSTQQPRATLAQDEDLSRYILEVAPL